MNRKNILIISFWFLMHTIRKVNIFSKNSILNFDRTLQFSREKSCQDLKSANPQHFHECKTNEDIKDTRITTRITVTYERPPKLNHYVMQYLPFTCPEKPNSS